MSHLLTSGSISPFRLVINLTSSGMTIVFKRDVLVSEKSVAQAMVQALATSKRSMASLDISITSGGSYSMFWMIAFDGDCRD